MWSWPTFIGQYASCLPEHHAADQRRMTCCCATTCPFTLVVVAYLDVQVATLTEQLATAKTKMHAAEDKVLKVAAAAAQLAVEEQEKAEKRMSDIKSEVAAGVSEQLEEAGEGEEQRRKKPKQKQMTLDLMLPKHAARARQLEAAAANFEEGDALRLAQAATVDGTKQLQGEEAEW